MQIAFLTEPVAHEEAARAIADKPALTRSMFDHLPTEMRGRALTITGVEDFDILQAVRDELAKLPAGADWQAVRKEVARKISPWFEPEAADARARLLLNHHGMAAYAAAHTRVLDEQVDVFPYRQYRSSRTSKEPRPAHQALDGLVLPADHPFWDKHTPPWEFGCKCMQPIPLTAEDADDYRKQDARRLPEERRVLEGAALAQIEAGTITRAQGKNVDIRTPKERGATYEWSAKDTRLPYEQIRQRWSEETAQDFEKWAAGIPLEGEPTLLAHLTGFAVPRPVLTRGPRPASFAEAFSASGLAEKAEWTRQDLANLRAAMRVENPLPATAAIASVEGTKSAGALTAAEIRRGVQDTLDLLPRELAATLPELRIRVVDRLTKDGRATGEAGRYRSGGRVQISAEALKGLKGEVRRREMRRILSHELMHWVHLDSAGPAADAYRAAIRGHYAARTSGEDLEPDPQGFRFRRDGWWDRYAGTEYDHEAGRAGGLEIPPTYYELWETPEKAMEFADLEHPGSRAFRETFAIVHSIFDSRP
jgi:hypothetical protein